MVYRFRTGAIWDVYRAMVRGKHATGVILLIARYGCNRAGIICTSGDIIFEGMTPLLDQFYITTCCVQIGFRNVLTRHGFKHRVKFCVIFLHIPIIYLVCRCCLVAKFLSKRTPSQFSISSTASLTEKSSPTKDLNIE